MTDAAFDLYCAGGGPWDAVVIGAGPAGALAARLVAAAGARVLLVDRKPFPRDKVCGGCLNGKALAVLAAAGLGGLVDRPGLGAVDLERVELRLAGRGVELPLPAGKALGRAEFDAALVEAAVNAGAAFLPGVGATIETGGARSGLRRVVLERAGQGCTVEAHVVVAAGGLAGTALRHERTLRTRIEHGARVGAGCAVTRFPGEYAVGTIHMAVGRQGYVGLVRFDSGVLNVAAALDRAFVRAAGNPAGAAAAVLDEAGFPAVPALADAAWHGTVPLTRRTRPVAAHRLFLIGDAAGYVEPFTGEGMAAALTTAQAVAPLVVRGASVRDWDDLLAAAWVRQYDRLVGRRQRLCRTLASALRRPRLAHLLLNLAAHSPALTGRLVRGLNEPPPLLCEAT